MFKLEIKPGQLELSDLRRVYDEPVQLSLHASCYGPLEASQKTITRIVESGERVYGVNTGFGKLAKEVIPSDQLEQLQENLVLSHACGTGPLLDTAIVRLMMVLKINALSQGYSGVRMEVLEALVAILNKEIYPCVPSKGSVGASGDLAPLAHMSLALLGYGDVHYNGKIIPAAKGLKKAGVKKLKLAPKEGLALLNGTQLSTALALVGLFMTESVFSSAMVAGALTIDAAKGSPAPFKREIHMVRRQKGQISVAEKYLELFKDSEIRESHRTCDRVQDPYSMRCMPQVMGACLDHVEFVAGILEREANAVTDNPLVFANLKQVLSGGNFHAEPVAMAADTLALAIAEIGNMSERRVAMLIDSNISELPPFLVKDAGVNSGFMIAHVTAAALASENKQKAYPACVDSIPTSANQEDHVSMATHGARRLLEMAENAATIVAIELLAAAQGIEFHRPLKTSSVLECVMKKIREKVPSYEEDRYFAPDIEAIKGLVVRGDLSSCAEDMFF